jgi:WD40 repeat protein
LNHRDLELENAESKIRHGVFDEDNSRLIVNEQTSRSFLVFDTKTFKLSARIAQVESIPLLVTKMAISNDKLVYALGKNIVVQSLSQHEAFKALSRQSKVTSLAISHDGKRIAVGDEAGKIYLLYNFMPDQSSKQAKLVIQSLP